MRRLRVLLLAAALVPPLAGEASAGPARLVEPQLRLPASAAPGVLRIALTLDACGGRTDARILDELVADAIPATIFATGVWLRRNPEAVAVLAAHPELFEVENHGARHVPAVDRPVRVYGIAAAGSPQAVEAEVDGGAEALVRAGLPAPRWFRGATARYSPAALEEIRRLGYRIAGYSLNADGGSLFPAAMAERRVEAARDGDVLLAHINQPTHPAGEGLVEGLRALKARSAVFVRLEDVDGAG